MKPISEPYMTYDRLRQCLSRVVGDASFTAVGDGYLNLLQRAGLLYIENGVWNGYNDFTHPRYLLQATDEELRALHTEWLLSEEDPAAGVRRNMEQLLLSTVRNHFAGLKPTVKNLQAAQVQAMRVVENLAREQGYTVDSVTSSIDDEHGRIVFDVRLLGGSLAAPSDVIFSASTLFTI